MAHMARSTNVQVEKQLDAVVTAGLLQRDDFNDRIMAALRGMQVRINPLCHIHMWRLHPQMLASEAVAPSSLLHCPRWLPLCRNAACSHPDEHGPCVHPATLGLISSCRLLIR